MFKLLVSLVVVNCISKMIFYENEKCLEIFPSYWSYSMNLILSGMSSHVLVVNDNNNVVPIYT